MILKFAALILAYIYAALLSTSVSMTLTATAWSSIWTYVALLGGLVLSVFTFVALIGAGFVFALLVTYLKTSR